MSNTSISGSELHTALTRTIIGLQDGTIDHKTAAATASVARAVVAVVRVRLRVLEATDGKSAEDMVRFAKN